MDLASSIEKVTEEVVLRLARTIQKELNADYLCYAGGVALNCVANGRILRETDFKDIWIQPAAGDAGGAVGAALAIWHQYEEKPRTPIGGDRQIGGFLKQRQNYWLIPLIVTLVSLGALMILTQSSAIAPFIYTVLV